MVHYQCTQWGTAMLGLILGSGLAAAAVLVSLRPSLWPLALGVLLLDLFMAVNFGSLTVTVARGRLAWSFGLLGLIRQSVSLDAIQDVAPVSLQSPTGWGIRRLGDRSRLVGIGGRAGLRITFTDQSFLELGTDDPDGLARALHQARTR
ncbi:MAG: hypothetical protein ACFE0O_11975 [Opitutales bacterium]